MNSEVEGTYIKGWSVSRVGCRFFTFEVVGVREIIFIWLFGSFCMEKGCKFV